jgi:hypothetical protein
MATSCHFGNPREKITSPWGDGKVVYEGPGGHDRRYVVTTAFWRPRGYREIAIMFFKGFLLVQTLIILFCKINPTTAIPSTARETKLSDLPPESWKKYVRAPKSNIIKPVRIISNYTMGNVKNPNGLITGKGTTLVRSPASGNATTAAGKPIYDIQPEIVIDFGQNHVGVLSIEFGGAKNFTPGLPGIRLAFSETIQYLTNVSDFSRSDNVSFIQRIF